ncbi:uncharacterized protein CBL_04959 [Carabus blaptoides fortunei]
MIYCSNKYLNVGFTLCGILRVASCNLSNTTTMSAPVAEYSYKSGVHSVAVTNESVSILLLSQAIIIMASWNIAVLLLLISLNYFYCYRLPTTLSPHNYDIEILTYLDEGDNHEFYFTGYVKIKVECLESTKNITMHSKQLDISYNETLVKDITSSDKNLKIVCQESDVDKDFYIIHLENPLKEKHRYEIHVTFKGKLDDGLAGYYRSSYVDKETDQKHWLAVTQFEATDARKAFPCFDEPSMKAKFKISLGHKADLSSISNMPLEKTEEMKDKKNWVLDRYEESVPMSTYLVAFVVSDFGYKTSQMEHSNITFNIWARKSALDQVEFAKEVGPKALRFYEEFFNINYPLPKQDMIALPDFSSGAMENWGLITYREIYLLLDPKIASASNKHRIASVIAHELAHQWFGNLVTMEWWTDLWLNEGFATYMASVAVHNLFPNWNSLNEEALNNLLSVYYLDSLKSSHPVSVPINNPNDIREIFDVISYKKGSFLIRMMDLFLGKDILRKGVSNYLREHEYNNAEQDDLWKSLTIQAHEDNALPDNLTVKMIMDTWTLQTGYPLINVKRNYEDGSVEITQERYYRNTKQKPTGQCWWVPLSYTTEDENDFNNTKPKIWLSCPKESQTIHVPQNDKWLIFNIQASGLYRVNYDEKNWKMLAEYLKTKHDVLPELNRVVLLDNVMELAWTGKLKYEIAFDLLSYIKDDNQYLPWDAALTKLGSVASMLKRTSSYGLIKSYINELVGPTYKALGELQVPEEKRESLDAVKYQVLIARAACKYDVDECTVEAANLFKQWKDNPEKPNPISLDMRTVVYCEAIRQGGEDEWNFLWQQYRESNVGTEKNLILGALGCTRQIWLLTRYLEWSIRNDTEIRKQDCSRVFSSVSGNPVGFFIAKSFFENHIKDIHEGLSPNQQRISSYVSTIARQLINERELNQFVSFLKVNMQYLGKAKIGVRQAMEGAESNVQWQKNHYNDVERVLKKYVHK